jgi:hypothetical protein
MKCELNIMRTNRPILLLFGWLLLATAEAVHAQFNYITTNGTITITGYTGTNAVVVIPSTIDGLPVTSIVGNSASGSGFSEFMTSVTIPNGVTNIGDYAFFQRCFNLTSVTIPDSVTSIGDDAFNGCSALTNVTIPSSVTAIGDLVFGFCFSLTNISVDALNPAYSAPDGVLFDKNRTTLLAYPGAGPGVYTIPDTVTSLRDYAFSDCTNLTGITISDSVTNIGGWAFLNDTSLTSVTIGSGLTSIGAGAFAYSGLTSVTIPDSVTSIGDDAFNGCTSLTNVTIGSGVTNINQIMFSVTSLETINVDVNNPFYSSVDGVLFDKSQTTLIQYPDSRAGSYTIPDRVTGIGENAFYYCTSLTGITIPNSVTSIGDFAFNGCPSLINIIIGSGLTNIGDHAFTGCPSLMAIDVSVDNNSFLSVDGVLFDKSQTTLIRFPVGSGAISYSIPNSVTNIGEDAFEGGWFDSGLTSVTIGSSVTSIGDDAFWACVNLTSVYFQGNAPSLGAGVFARPGEFPWAIYDPATVYYLPGTTGWGMTFGGLPTAIWQPQIQPSDTSFGVNSNQFGFRINWASGMTVVVEASTSLSGGTWTPLQTNVLNSSSFYFSDPEWTNYPNRFYRLRSP